MPDLVAWAGDDSNRGWRRTLPESGEVTLGRKVPQSVWDCPWDQQISRLHAHLSWRDGKLWVRKDAKAVNPIFFRGQVAEHFVVGVGEQFVIGNTKFALLESERTFVPEPTPHHEMTCSHQQLQAIKFADADERIAALADLPSLIRHSPSDQDLERRVVDVLLAGIPRAQVAAVVWLNPSSKEGLELRTSWASARGGRRPDLQPSRRLVHSAICLRRQSVMQSWGGKEGDFTASSGLDWAICAPLPDEPLPGWALYVAGRLDHQSLSGGSATLEDLHTGDLKFAEMVADIFGALRQVRDLQRRQTTMARFFSGPVLAALTADSNQDLEEVLRPRQTQVTVLFCDLRGSCRIAEDAEDNLATLCDRVSEALTIMTNQIIDKDGVIGDFHGDAAMGFWGWPLDRDHQVEQAARAALAIRKDFLRYSQRKGHPLEGFACGIGIAHGSAIAGRLGTQDQFKVSVFGPVVNLASRLESMTRLFQVPIIMDEKAAEQLVTVDSLRLRCRRLAKVQPFGMSRIVQVHELLPPATEPMVLSEPDRRDYEAALDAFQKGLWENAWGLLAPLRDGAADFLRLYMDRHQGRAPDNWGGVIALDSK